MPVRPDLTGKIALVTGGTRGIGLAIVEAFAQAGAKVIVSSRKAEAVQQVVARLAAVGHEVVGIPANMGRPDDVARLAAEAVAAFGGLQVVVNNAAVNPVYGPVEQTTDEAFDKIVAVNVKGPFALCRAVLPALKERGGSIVNVSSIGGVSPEQGLGIYSMSKAALISLTQVMAREWGPAGIRANAICPGLIRTDFSQVLWQDEALVRRMLAHQPIPRLGEPDDVAGLALFLASDAAGYCTGGTFMADGGFTT